MTRTLRYISSIAIAGFTLSALTYTAVSWKTEVRCDTYRTEGSKALELEQYTIAAEKLGNWLENPSCGEQNADLLYAYARARARLPEPGGKHLIASIRSLKQAVLIEPEATHAWRELALAWLGMGEPARAADAARKVVALDPADDAAFRLLITGLLASGKDREVLDMVTQTLQQTPERWWLHIARLSALASTESSIELQAVDTQYLTAEQSRLVELYSAILQGRIEEAKDSLEGITINEPVDTLYLQSIVNLMWGIEMYPAVLDLLHTHRLQLVGKLRREYLELAWQAGRTEWVLDYLTEQPAHIDHEPALLLLQTLSSRSANSENLNMSLIAEPGNKDSQAKQRWQRLLKVSALQNDDAELVEALEQVLEIEPRNAVLFQLMAEAWIRLREPLRAARVAERAMQLAPGWAGPAITRAQALLGASRPAAALQSAREAARRAPNDPLAGLILAQVWSQNLQSEDPQDAEALLKLVDALQTTTRTGEPASLNAIRELVTTKFKGRSVAINNSAVNDEGQRSKSQSAPSPTMNVPNSKNILECNEQTPEDAYMACWRDLLSQHSDKLSSNLLALSSAAEKSNVQFQEEIIEHIMTLTPSSSNLWRLARARLLLSSETSEKTAAEAALLLRYVLQRSPDQADAHLLMANAMAHLDDRTAIGAHLNEAVVADPTRAKQALQVSLYLARDVIKIEPRTLLGWWESITWLESAYLSGQSLSANPLQSKPELNNDRSEYSSLSPRLSMLAAFAESESDIRLAEVVYRRLLQLDNKAHIASNNLAMILSNNERFLDEAMRLARNAVEIKPSNSDYQDTLKVVLAAKKATRQGS